MEYLILSEENHFNSLSKAVNEKIKEGWIPQGGVSVAVTQGNYKIYTQAMIKIKQ